MDLEELFQEMENCKNKVVLVEGPNDRKALEKLGFTNIVELHKPLYKMVELLQDKTEVIILTDLDAHGRKLYKHFYSELTKRGVKIDNRLRLMLFETPLQQIEGLDTFLSRIRP